MVCAPVPSVCSAVGCVCVRGGWVCVQGCRAKRLRQVQFPLRRLNVIDAFPVEPCWRRGCSAVLAAWGPILQRRPCKQELSYAAPSWQRGAQIRSAVLVLLDWLYSRRSARLDLGGTILAVSSMGV